MLCSVVWCRLYKSSKDCEIRDVSCNVKGQPPESKHCEVDNSCQLWSQRKPDGVSEQLTEGASSEGGGGGGRW